MKTFFFKITVMTLFLLISCNTTTQTILAKECPTFPKNDFNSVVLVEQKSSVGSELRAFNEARYTCVSNVNYLSKAMFDTFGKWDKTISPDSGQTTLVWERVQLFGDEKTSFQVATSGVELKTKVFASVSVFNQNGEDLLSDASPLKEQLITYFGNLIKNNDDSKKEFYTLK
jgi:hypothetical protein